MRVAQGERTEGDRVDTSVCVQQRVREAAEQGATRCERSQEVRGVVERESECRGRGSVRAQGRPGSRRPDTAQSRRARAGLRVVGRWGVEGGSGSVSTDRVRSCSSRLDAHLVNRGALRGVPTPRVVAERTCDADAPATRDLFGRAAAARKTDMARRTVRVGWGGEEVKSDAGVRFRSFVRSREIGRASCRERVS